MGRSGRLAIGAIGAALAAGHIAPNFLGAAVALTLAALLVLGEAHPRRGVRLVLPIVVGAGLIAVRLAIAPPSVSLGLPPEGAGPWSMMVVSTGSPREGHQVATLETSPGAAPHFRVSATLPRYPVVTPGDRVVIDGTIRPRPDSPYGAYLERLGAVGTVTARTLEVTPTPDVPWRRLEDLRRGAAEALARVLPEPEAGLAAGILIGLRDRVDRDLAAAFTTAGVSHVVAISGWNIAIVAAAVAAMAGGLGRRRRSVVTIVAIVAYVAFAGGSPSVVRAALMAGVVLLARESGRAGRATAALGWAATLLLISDPGLIADAGFQLSSLATAGLIAWATPLTAWLARLGRGRLPGWLAESLGVSLAAQAATLPIILVSFGRLAILSPLVNLFVVPLVAPAMAVGIVALIGGALVVGGVPAGLGAVLAAPAWVILRVLVAVVEAAAGLPFASISLGPPLDAIAATVVVAGLVGITRWRRGPRMAPTDRAAPTSSGPGSQPATHDGHQRGGAATRAGLVALIVAATVAGGVVTTRSPGIARVSVLDVGQGDAILVEGSRGGRLLIDGGPDPDRLLVELDRRIPPWDRRIDAVILSHPHEDHVAGLGLLLERYRVDRVFEPGMRGPGPGYAAWVRRVSGPASPIRLGLAAGDHLKVDEVALRVLWPLAGAVPAEPPDGGTGINNVSVVVLGEVGGRRFLLMGDIEEEIDPSLLAAGLPTVDLLKVAHHGSRTATTEPFVAAVRPRVAVASAGAGNPYGHPTRATLDRLAAAGARVLRTDRDGTVVVGFEADGMTVRTEGGRAATAVKRGPDLAAAFRCAIPVTALVPDPAPPPPAPAAMASRVTAAAATVRARSQDPGRDRSVGYHRFGDPAGVLLGRRRLLDGSGSRPLRGRAGGRRRGADGALDPAWEQERRDQPRRGPPRASRHGGHVRWRDAGGRLECRGPRGQGRGSRRVPCGDDRGRPGERPRHPRREPVGRELTGTEATGRRRRDRRRHGPSVPVTKGGRSRRLDRGRGADARPRARGGRGEDPRGASRWLRQGR
jgi:competence protein ComEC